MKRQVVWGVWLALLWMTPVVAEIKTEIERENDYGGKTVEIIYEADDQEPKLAKKRLYYDGTGAVIRIEGDLRLNDYNRQGILKGIETYDSTGRVTSIVIEFTRERAVEQGYQRVLTFFDERGKKAREETYFVPNDAHEMTYAKSIRFYAPDGHLQRAEYLLSEAEKIKTGYHKVVVCYEGNRVIKREMYDMQGNIF